MTTDNGRILGTVQWFSRVKGYGFIRGSSGQDVFVHRSGLADGAPSLLRTGQKVEYSVEQTPRGPTARGVIALA